MTAVTTKRGPAASFFRDLSMLFRVFFVRGLFVGRRWLFPVVLVCTASGYEIAASTILNVIGDFYLAISSLDAELFLQVRVCISLDAEPMRQLRRTCTGMTVSRAMAIA